MAVELLTKSLTDNVVGETYFDVNDDLQIDYDVEFISLVNWHMGLVVR